MRRTPLGFEHEEENHLNKMLKAGVVRPSESNWASAPVLIRKKNGSVTMLSYPTNTGLFIIDTDASDTAIGAELLQVQEGREVPIAFASTVLTSQQRRYCTTRKELLAVIVFTRQFRHYLLGRKVVLRTDHHSLVWLTRCKRPEGKLARWLE